MQRIKESIESILEDVEGLDSETIGKLTSEIEEHLIAGVAHLISTRKAAEQFIDKHGGSIGYDADDLEGDE